MLVSFNLLPLYPLIVLDLEVNRRLVRCVCVVTLFLFSGLVSASDKMQPVHRIISFFLLFLTKEFVFDVRGLNCCDLVCCS